METLLWHDFCSTHHFFLQFSAANNFWVAARVKKKRSHSKYISSAKDVNSISETDWNVLLNVFYFRDLQELKKKISGDLIFLMKLNY